MALPYYLAVVGVLCEDVEYLGCYIDQPDRDLDGYLSPSIPTMTINTCIATCKDKGMSLFFLNNLDN